ncbi:EscU/YscU/HrcU family type III secretion system export apparatus switch protein [Ramlibacter sp. MAHUQ-53]|uniref:EscU/YscU/HrcU family type III secretion system export apparatus switch protein n=1 Tax=unclassified Ramlibacter TaxID=2617605 RepID=UPI003645444E
MSASETSREDRELPATERRLEQARERGQVPRSRDLGHLAAAGALLALLTAAAPLLADQALRLVATALRFDRAAAFESDALALRLGTTGLDSLLWVLPVLALIAAVAVAATLAVGGWNVSTEALEPKFERLDPLAGLQRLFGWRQALMQLRLAAVAAILLGAAGWWLAGHAATLDAIARMPLVAALATGFGWISGGVSVLLAVMVVSAVADVPLQLFKHKSDLKMTREEVRQENKESEGDPHVKGERRRRQRQMARGRMMAAVPTASVVVTNPTHYAVALHYDEATMAAPRIVALGADHLAFRIREIAAANGVPTLEAPPLARALYRHGDLDAEVPVALYGAVAQVLAWVMRLRAALRPLPAPTIDVPPGLDPLEAKP